MYIGTSKVTRSGQVTLPQGLRKDAGIEIGSEIVFCYSGKDIRILSKSALEQIFSQFEISASKQGITGKTLEQELKEARETTLRKYEKA